MGVTYNPLTGLFDLTGGSLPADNVTSNSIPSTDNSIARYDGTDGTVIQDSLATIDNSGNIDTPGDINGVTPTELGYVSGVTSSIQDQLDDKIDTTLTDAHIFVGDVNNLATDVAVTGDISISNAGVTAINSGVIVNDDINSSAGIDVSKFANGLVSNTEFQYLDGVTSAIQDQLDDKANIELDNLGTTAINANLVPDGSATRGLGSDSNPWGNCSLKLLYYPLKYTLNLDEGGYYNPSGVQIFDPGNQFIRDNSNNAVIKYGDKYLVDGSDDPSIQWGDRALSDGSVTQLSWSASGVRFAQLTVSTVPYLDGNKDLVSSAVTPTELGYVSGVTSAIQTQLDSKPNKSSGDINETSFTAADNQSSPANVTGLVFANATVRSFEAILSIVRDTTYAQYKLNGVQGASSWYFSQTYLGDDTGIEFTITTAGQIQYTSSNTGSSAAVKFRAITTSVA